MDTKRVPTTELLIRQQSIHNVVSEVMMPDDWRFLDLIEDMGVPSIIFLSSPQALWEPTTFIVQPQGTAVRLPDSARLLGKIDLFATGKHYVWAVRGAWLQPS